MENQKPNVAVSPFASYILKGLVTDWLNQSAFAFNPDGALTDIKNRDLPFDENDSYAWTIKDMKEIEEQLKELF